MALMSQLSLIVDCQEDGKLSRRCQPIVTQLPDGH